MKELTAYLALLGYLVIRIHCYLESTSVNYDAKNQFHVRIFRFSLRGFLSEVFLSYLN